MCKIVKLVSLCHAAPLSKAVVVSRYHTGENFKFQNGQPRRTIRSVLCEKIVPMHASAKVCRKCQKMKLTIPTQISNTCNKENENAMVSSDYKMNNNIKQQNSTTKDNIMKMFPGACEDVVEILLNQANNLRTMLALMTRYLNGCILRLREESYLWKDGLGGIILDEIAIQSDLQINKCGDLEELSGLVEIGAEGNTCHT